MAIREKVEAMSPRWLRNFVAVRVMYVIGLHVDRLLEKMFQAQIAHQPGMGTNTALPALGQARLIPRGATETDTSYAGRLRTSWDDWGFAGANRGVLLTTLGALLALMPDALTVSVTPDGTMGVWDSFFSGDPFTDTTLTGAPSHFVGLDWNWDGTKTWWRVFLVIYSVAPNAVWTSPPAWGSGLSWGNGFAWGCSQTNAVGTAINASLKNWRAGHGWMQWWIVSFDANLFRPNNRPDGTWGNWGKVAIVNGARTYVSSRNQSASYTSGPGVTYP